MMYYLVDLLTVETLPSVLRGEILLKIKTVLGDSIAGKVRYN